MRRFVLDASVALAWFLDRPTPKYAEAVRQGMLNGDRAMVPPLWQLEMVNGFVVAERRGFFQASDTAEAFQELHVVMSVAIETSYETIPSPGLLATARRFLLTAYDAVYLETSLRMGLPLATLDRKLQAAAEKAGLEILPPTP